MASYVPESVSNAAAQINDDYNPLAEAKQPSEAHGKFVYVKGMAHQSYGEATQSSSYVASGGQLKVQGAAEIQAARTGVEVDRWKDMVSKGDFEGMGDSVGGIAEQAGKGVGDVVGAGAGGIESGGKMMGDQPGGHYPGKAVEGVGNVGTGVGQAVGDVTGGVGKGLGSVGGGLSKGLGFGGSEKE